MKTITIDFETYYSKEYSLSKMTTQEYVEDPRFEVIGLSVLEDGKDTQWFSGNLADTALWLAQFDWANSCVAAHNCTFDGYILEKVFNIKPAKYFCTMMASRPNIVPFTGRMGLGAVAEYLKLPAKGDAVHNAIGMHREDFTPRQLRDYADYCKRDTFLARAIYDILREDLPQDEQDLIDLTVKKFTRPKFLLDKALIAEELERVSVSSEELQAQATLVCGVSDFRKNAEFAAFLDRKGITNYMKPSPSDATKQIEAFAKTDPFMKELAHHPDWEVELAWRARTNAASTITETRLRKFLAMAELGTPFCVPLLYAGAHTLRFSGAGGLNLQNLPRGSALRRAIMAPPGYKILAVDYSQIEVRMVAWLAGQLDMLEAFAKGRDIYKEFGSKLYNKPVSEITGDERFIAKMAVLSLGYGAGPDRFYETMRASGVDMTPQEARIVVHTYRTTYSNISGLWNKLDALIGSINGANYTAGPGGCRIGMGHMLLPNGMKMYYRDLKRNAVTTNKKGVSNVWDGWSYIKGGRGRAKLYGAAWLENISQSLSRIIMTDSELALAKHGVTASLSIHDELLFVVKDENVDVVTKAVEYTFLHPKPWAPGIPLACEAAVGQTYADAK